MTSTPVFDCLVAGEANIDLLMEGITELELGTEKLAERMDLVLGGSSSITAFNLASMSASVAFCGVVGDDLFGRFVETSLQSAGVDTTRLRRTSDEKTGLTIWHTRAGKRAGVTYPGTIALLRAEDVTNLDQARHLHVGAYFLLKQFHSGAPALFKHAKHLGVSTSLDCNYDPEELWDSGIRKVLPYVDFFFPNEDEARQLTAKTNIAAAARQLAEWGNTVAVKRGSRGALVCREGELFHLPAVKAKVVDTTGAGDSFNAGFLSAHLKGKDLLESTQAGIVAGARCVAHAGGTAAFQKAP